MAAPKPPRLPQPVLDAIEATGLPLRLERGRKHWKLFLGARMATVIGHGRWPDGCPKHIPNTIREIKRCAAAQREEDR